MDVCNRFFFLFLFEIQHQPGFVGRKQLSRLPCARVRTVPAFFFFFCGLFLSVVFFFFSRTNGFFFFFFSRTKSCCASFSVRASTIRTRILRAKFLCAVLAWRSSSPPFQRPLIVPAAQAYLVTPPPRHATPYRAHARLRDANASLIRPQFPSLDFACKHDTWSPPSFPDTPNDRLLFFSPLVLGD